MTSNLYNNTSMVECLKVILKDIYCLLSNKKDVILTCAMILHWTVPYLFFWSSLLVLPAPSPPRFPFSKLCAKGAPAPLRHAPAPLSQECDWQRFCLRSLRDQEVKERCCSQDCVGAVRGVRWVFWCLGGGGGARTVSGAFFTLLHTMH